MKHFYRRIHSDEKFHELERKRGIFSWTLTLIVLISYYSFILIIAFFPHIFSQPISTDSVITWGIPIGLSVILISFLLTGIYVFRANREFDLISKEIVAHHINDEHE